MGNVSLDYLDFRSYHGTQRRQPYWDGKCVSGITPRPLTEKGQGRTIYKQVMNGKGGNSTKLTSGRRIPRHVMTMSHSGVAYADANQEHFLEATAAIRKGPLPQDRFHAVEFCPIVVSLPAHMLTQPEDLTIVKDLSEERGSVGERIEKKSS